jgi:hypothetical protein
MSSQSCQAKMSVRPAPVLHCATKALLCMSACAPHGVAAFQGVTRSLASRLGVSGCRGDPGDCGTFGQAVCNSQRYGRDAL